MLKKNKIILAVDIALGILTVIEAVIKITEDNNRKITDASVKEIIKDETRE